MGEKKKYILKNVGELYLKFGIRSVTMDNVASEFGVSKKTLYQFFADKADLVGQVVDYHLTNPCFDFNAPGNGNAIDRYFALRRHIITIMRHFNNNIEFDLKKQYPDIYCKVHQMKRERIFEGTKRNIEEGMAEGLFRRGLDAALIAKLHIGRMLFTLNPENEVFQEDELKDISLFDRVIDYHMHAICAPAGLAYYKKQLNKIHNEVKN